VGAAAGSGRQTQHAGRSEKAVLVRRLRCNGAVGARPPATSAAAPKRLTHPVGVRMGGITRFFKGAGVISVTVLTEKGGLFFWYAVLKALWGRWTGVPTSAVAGLPALFCGWGAENLAIPTRYPFEVILRDQQTSTRNESIMETARRIYKHEGIGGFYKGSYVYLLYGFRSGIQQSMYDQMRVMRLASLAARGVVLTELSFWSAFVFAGIGRFVATLLTYPLMRAKVMAISEDGQKLGLIGCIR
jgi:adenine nucleotide transporter 17